MSKEGLSKLFTKYGQVTTDVALARLGTGLGLWITSQLCHKMGGDIRAYSNTGHGSTFVALVKSDAAVQWSKMDSPVSSQDLEVPQPLKSRIFKAMMDDNSENRDVVRRWFLDQSGMLVSE